MKQGQVRIISGYWRGRLLKVPTVAGLRPTPDRVRETLFNWLSPVLPGAYCLDAFAGSGALGFEALSRGAAHVVMVDQSIQVIQLLQEECARWKAENMEIYQGRLPEGLRVPSKPFDIVFLDPPYKEGRLLPTCFYLEEKGFLAPDAHIYVESPQPVEESALPSGWERIKCKKAGQVVYQLVRKRGCII